MLVAAGAAVRAAGRLPDVNPLSLAPTMLTLLDVAPSVEMTGSPLLDWLTSPTTFADTGT
jgi:hypothetical protein